MSSTISRSNGGGRRGLAVALVVVVGLVVAACESASSGDSQTSASDTSAETAASVTLTPPSTALESLPGEDVEVVTERTVPTNVAIVGDSLTVASQELLEDSLDSLGVKKVVIDGIEGRRMTGHSPGKPPGIDAVEAIIATGFEPDVWVIELGTNDVGAQVKPDAFQDDMEAILALLPRATPVVWVNVYLGHRIEATEEANEIITTVTAARPQTMVADWHNLATGKPELLTDDGVHLHERGEVAYSLVIADAVAKSVSS